MTYNEMINLLTNDARFSSLQANPTLLKETMDKLAVIFKSGKIKDQIMVFFSRQRELERYKAIAKKIAGLKPQDTPYETEIEDKLLRNATDEQIKAVFEDDARAFYYQIDSITDGNHNIYQKVDKKLAEIVFARDIQRSGVGSSTKNGITKWHIEVDIKPVVNNRTVTMHELWHAIDEKNYSHDTSLNGRGEQFIGEIGTMFIDRLAYDFLLNNHSNDRMLINGIKTLRETDWNTQIYKAREAYLDILICEAMYGKTEAEREQAQQEILNNYGKVFGQRLVGRLINKLYDTATKPDSHFDPMFELKYIVGHVVSDAVYNQESLLKDKIDKIATLNENIITLKGISNDPKKSPIDAVTEFFGVDNIETLVNNYQKELVKNRQDYLTKI